MEFAADGVEGEAGDDPRTCISEGPRSCDADLRPTRASRWCERRSGYPKRRDSPAGPRSGRRRYRPTRHRRHAPCSPPGGWDLAGSPPLRGQRRAPRGTLSHHSACPGPHGRADLPESSTTPSVPRARCRAVVARSGTRIPGYRTHRGDIAVVDTQRDDPLSSDSRSGSVRVTRATRH